MTVQDLIAALKNCDLDSEVRLAHQPNYPFEYSIGAVEEVFFDEGPDVVYVAERSQLGYLPGDARDALGW